MRIADKMAYSQVETSLNKNRGEIQKLQNQAATQKRITKPSDDPVSSHRVLVQKTELKGMEQYLKNIASAKNFLEYSEQSLGELTEALTRAKELAIGQANDASGNSETRRVVAAEVEQLFHQAVRIGNRKLGDRFLFGGFKTTQPPFKLDGDFQGDNGEIKIPINKEAKVAINLSGAAVFKGADLRSPIPDPEVQEEMTPTELQLQDPNNTKELRQVRGPASISSVAVKDANDFESEMAEEPKTKGTSYSWQSDGVDIFKVLKDLEISLKSNDKSGVQDSLEEIDEALAQVVLSRAKLGARVSTIEKTFQTLQQAEIDAKLVRSQAEDVDTFELVNNINKAENTLQASLQTSSKLMQPSLLDFLR